MGRPYLEEGRGHLLLGQVRLNVVHCRLGKELHGTDAYRQLSGRPSPAQPTEGEANLS